MAEIITLLSTVNRAGLLLTQEEPVDDIFKCNICLGTSIAFTSSIWSALFVVFILLLPFRITISP